MKVDGGSGREDGPGAYHKPTAAPSPHAGAVYAVAGSSGQISGGTLNHPAMFISLNQLGSMVLDLDGGRLDAKFLNNTGTIADYFTILKDLSVPDAPSGLGATAASSSQINLAWTDNASDELGFKIERSTNGTTFSEIATVGTGVTAYSNTGLAASTTYYYRVRAYNAVGNSTYSNTANATTQAGASLPAAPSNLTATAVSRSQINLAWSDNSTNETGFKIERSTNGASFSQIATVGSNQVTYSNTGLARNKRYYYRVRAYNGAGNSAYSNTANARTPK
jgi:titin